MTITLPLHFTIAVTGIPFAKRDRVRSTAWLGVRRKSGCCPDSTEFVQRALSVRYRTEWAVMNTRVPTRIDYQQLAAKPDAGIAPARDICDATKSFGRFLDDDRAIISPNRPRSRNVALKPADEYAC